MTSKLNSPVFFAIFASLLLGTLTTLCILIVNWIMLKELYESNLMLVFIVYLGLFALINLMSFFSVKRLLGKWTTIFLSVALIVGGEGALGYQAYQVTRAQKNIDTQLIQDGNQLQALTNQLKSQVDDYNGTATSLSESTTYANTKDCINKASRSAKLAERVAGDIDKSKMVLAQNINNKTSLLTKIDGEAVKADRCYRVLFIQDVANLNAKRAAISQTQQSIKDIELQKSNASNGIGVITDFSIPQFLWDYKFKLGTAIFATLMFKLAMLSKLTRVLAYQDLKLSNSIFKQLPNCFINAKGEVNSGDVPLLIDNGYIAAVDDPNLIAALNTPSFGVNDNKDFKLMAETKGEVRFLMVFKKTVPPMRESLETNLNFNRTFKGNLYWFDASWVDRYLCYKPNVNR